MSELPKPRNRKIAIGADHAGFTYKARFIQELRNRGVSVEDLGAFTEDRDDDYVDFALNVARAVSSGQADFGILICGSGVGMNIAADKVKGIRAALCSDTYTARKCREHNDANVLVLAERVIGIELALDIVLEWVETPFSGEDRHKRRLEKIHQEEGVA